MAKTAKASTTTSSPPAGPSPRYGNYTLLNAQSISSNKTSRLGTLSKPFLIIKTPPKRKQEKYLIFIPPQTITTSNPPQTIITPNDTTPNDTTPNHTTPATTKQPLPFGESSLKKSYLSILLTILTDKTLLHYYLMFIYY